MVDILGDDISKCIFSHEIICILIQISLNILFEGPLVNRWAFGQVMAWCTKPLPEQMLTYWQLDPRKDV